MAQAIWKKGYSINVHVIIIRLHIEHICSQNTLPQDGGIQAHAHIAHFLQHSIVAYK